MLRDISGFTLAGERGEGYILATMSVSDQGDDVMHRLPANIAQVAAMSSQSSGSVVVRRPGETAMQQTPSAAAPPSDQSAQSQVLFHSPDNVPSSPESDVAMVCSLPPGQGEPKSPHESGAGGGISRLGTARPVPRPTQPLHVTSCQAQRVPT